MKKFILLSSFLLISPIFLITLISLLYFSIVSPQPVILAQNLSKISISSQPIHASGAVVSQVQGVTTSVQTADARPIIIAEFLRTNNSPLKPYDYYGQVLTRIADKYELDFRLLPAIMMQESNLCKKIPKDSFNCLGLGIHSQGTWTFTSYKDNFEAAAKILRKNYLDQGLITPDQIQNKYTPSSNGSWEFAVNHFMDILETAEF